MEILCRHIHISAAAAAAEETEIGMDVIMHRDGILTLRLTLYGSISICILRMHVALSSPSSAEEIFPFFFFFSCNLISLALLPTPLLLLLLRHRGMEETFFKGSKYLNVRRLQFVSLWRFVEILSK
jgi:hypothetical protein